MKKLVYLVVLFFGLVSLSACGSKSLDEVLTGEWSYSFDLKTTEGITVSKGNYTFYDNGEVDVVAEGDDKYYVDAYKIADNVLVVESQEDDTGELLLTYQYKLISTNVKKNVVKGSVSIKQSLNDNPLTPLEGTFVLKKVK